jgi:formate dehydrogenase subunit delta
MSPEKLVHMANQIATFFASQPGTAEDHAAAIARHFQDFWEPRMRDQLHAHIAAGAAGLSAEVVAAARLLPEATATV